MNTPITVQIVQGDICQENTDAICNPTDSFGQLTKGVGAQLAYFGGPSIQEEINLALERQIQVPTGNVLSTGAGKFRSKHIIHAVGPNYNCASQRGLDMTKLLSFTTQKALEEAIKLNCKSISVPAISCGAFGFPRKQCA